MTDQRVLDPVDRTVRDHAACHGCTDLFYPEPPTRQTTRNGRPFTWADHQHPDYQTAVAHALTICENCPVRYRCLAEALNEPYELDLGIRGGATEAERHRIRRSRTRRDLIVMLAGIEGTVAS